MRLQIGVCVYKMSLKNDLEGTCVLACMCTRLHAHAAPVHYWPAAEGSHFPVFIKTWSIKFYLQSIIRTPQINQRQLNQCFPGSVPGPHGPHGHSIFTAGLIHGRLRWSHIAHPLACSWLLDSIVPWFWLWSAAYGGSLLRGAGFDFINSPVEVRDEKMNAMFHFVLSGHVGQGWGGSGNLWHFYGMKGAVTSTHTPSHIIRSATQSLLAYCQHLSFLLRWHVAVHDSDCKQWPTHRQRRTHRYLSSYPHTHTHTEWVMGLPLTGPLR